MLSRFSQLTQSISEELLQGPKETRSDPVSVIERNGKLLRTETPDVSEILVSDPTDGDTSRPEQSQGDQPHGEQPQQEQPQREPPQKEQPQRGQPQKEQEPTPEPAANESGASSASPKAELTLEQKLAKFAKFEEKYPQLLKAYRLEKRKNELVKLFEKVLSEATPCTSISEPQQLLNYLRGLTTKNDLLKGELERVTKALDAKPSANELERARKEGYAAAESELRAKIESEVANAKPENVVNEADLRKKIESELRAKTDAELESKIEAAKAEVRAELDKGNASETVAQAVAQAVADQKAEHKKQLQKLKKDLKKARKRAGISGPAEESEEEDTAQADEAAAQASETAEKLRLEQERNEKLQLQYEQSDKTRVAKIAELESTVSSLQSKVDQQSTLQKRLDASLAEGTSLQQKLKAAETALAEHSKSADQGRTQIEQLQKQVQDLKRRVGVAEGLDARNAERLAEEKRIAAAERTDLQAQLQQAKQQLRNSQAAGEAAVKAQTLLRTQLQELNQRLSEATASADVLRDEAAESSRVAQERQQEALALRNQLHNREKTRKFAANDAESQIQALTAEREHLEAEIETIGKRLARESESMHAQIRTLRDQLAESEASAAAYRQEIESLRASRRQSVSSPPVSAPVPHLENGKQETQTLASLADVESRLKNAERANELLKRVNEDAAARVERLQRAQRALSQDAEQLRHENTRLRELRDQRRLSVTSSYASSEAGEEDDTEKQKTYIKNVLLGFLEHPDQRHQLMPVIATLLHFEGNDQQRFWAAMK